MKTPLLCVVLLAATATLSAQAFHYRDDFNRNTLGPAYTGFGWNLEVGQLHTDLGGFGEAITRQGFTPASYLIQSAIRGLDPGFGPSAGDRMCLVFGANDQRTNELRACVYLSFGPHVALIHRYQISNGELTEQVLETKPVSYNAADWYKLTVWRNGPLGVVTVWFSHEDDPIGAPLYRGIDTTSPALGHFGWIIDRESPPKTNAFYVDYINVVGE